MNPGRPAMGGHSRVLVHAPASRLLLRPRRPLDEADAGVGGMFPGSCPAAGVGSGFGDVRRERDSPAWCTSGRAG